MTVAVRAVARTDSSGLATSITVSLACVTGDRFEVSATCGGGVDIHGTTPISSTSGVSWAATLINTLDGTNNQRLVTFGSSTAAASTATYDFTVTFASSAEYRGIYVKAIADSSGYDKVAGQLQASPTTGTGATTSGNTAALASQPALVSGFCMSTADGTTTAVDTAAGFAADDTGTWWQFGFGANFAQSESKRVTATTAVAATFTASANSARLSHVVTWTENGAGGGGGTQPPRSMHQTRLRRAA